MKIETPDLANNGLCEIYLGDEPVIVAAPIKTGGTIKPGDLLTIIIVQPGGKPSPAWSEGYRGAEFEILLDANTYCCRQFIATADGRFTACSLPLVGYQW